MIAISRFCLTPEFRCYGTAENALCESESDDGERGGLSLSRESLGQIVADHDDITIHKCSKILPGLQLGNSPLQMSVSALQTISSSPCN